MRLHRFAYSCYARFVQATLDLAGASYAVVDTRGSLVQQREGSAAWAGNAQLLTFPPGTPPTTGGGIGGRDFLDVRSGALATAPDTPSLICVSPDGAWGLYYRETRQAQQPALHLEAKNLATGAAAVEATVPRSYINCDWTPDSSRVVISPGGK